MENLNLRTAKRQIITFLNGLPYSIEVKRLLVKDIYDEVRDAADDAIDKENYESKKALEEAKKQEEQDN